MTNLHKLAEFLAELDYHEEILEQLPLFLREITIDHEPQILEKSEVIIGDVIFTI